LLQEVEQFPADELEAQLLNFPMKKGFLPAPVDFVLQLHHSQFQLLKVV
jgi:hypothetical protein